MCDVHVPEVDQQQTRCELTHHLASNEEGQLVAGSWSLRTIDVLHQAPGQRFAHVLIKLPSALKDRPADAFVSLAENAFQLAAHVFPVRDTATRALADHLLHGFEKQLLRQYDIRAVGLAPRGHGTRTHRSKTLVGRYDPGVHRRGSGAFTKVLEQGRARGRLKAEVVHSLPVARDDTRGGVEVRKNAGIG